MGNVLNFDAMRAEKQNGKVEHEPRTFTLAGKEYRLVDQLPGILHLEMGILGDDTVPGSERLRSAWRVLKGCVLADDWAALDERLRDPALEMGIEEVIQLTAELAGVLVARPPEQEPDSPTG